MKDEWGLEPVRPDLPEPFRSNMIRWHEDLRIKWSFLKRYAPRGCEKCGTTDHLSVFAPRVFRSLTDEIMPVLRIGNEGAVRDLLDGIGAEVYCGKCARQIPSNGRWSGILEARRLEGELAKGEKTDG